jgi:gamma-glutamyltranspeptidase/glutathione hydrolase
MQTVRGGSGMVTAPHAAAAAAGARILAAGGTAIEAAVATVATLTVVYPHMTGLGGDSFWLVASPGQAPVAIDGAGRAGASVSAELFAAQGLAEIPWRGPLAAITVAGAVAAWQEALTISAAWGGRCTLASLFADAILRAEQGTPVTASHAGALSTHGAALGAVQDFRGLHAIDGRWPETGAILRQPALALTLAQLARDGLRSFYSGALARQMAAELAQAGSPLTAADLEAQQASQRRPLSLLLPQARVFNTGPPSQGLASLLILGLFARLGVNAADGFAHVHGLVECTKRAFAIRDREIGHREDDGADLAQHLEPAALAAQAAAIDPARAAPWPAGNGAGDTVWFGCIDAAGRSASVIQSIYFEFGSGVTLPQSGFVWQNRGSAFCLHGTGPNLVGPRRKPFHTLNPAMARFADGRTMVYGAMGGDGQPQTQAALFTRYALFGQDLQAAISAPRWLLGRTWGESHTALRLESRFPPALSRQLAAAGHSVLQVAALDQAMGHAGAIVHRPQHGFEGASDPRSDGAAVPG